MSEIHVDGSGWSGKVSGYAIVFPDNPNKFPVVVKEEVNKTNNEREYEAIIVALRDHAEKGDVILSDCKLACDQVYGRMKVKEMRLFGLCNEVRALLTAKQCTLQWIERNQNKAGKLL